MKSALLLSTGALFLGMTACGNSSSGTSATGGTTAGTGGNAAGTGGASAGTGGTTTGSGGSTTGTGGTSNGTGGGPSGTGGITAGTGGAVGGNGGAVSGTGGTAAGGAAGGSPGGGGAAGGSGGPLPTIVGTNQMFPTFDNAFLITPCFGSGGGFDCPSLLGGGACPTAAWSYTDKGAMVATTEATGATYSEPFVVMGGDPNAIYNVTVRVRGQAEGRIYTGGVRAPNAPAVDPTAAVNNLLWIGGRPGTTRVDYNAFQMTISPPTGGAVIPNATTFFAFNATDAAHEGNHYNYALDETFTFQVKSGFQITLTSHDSNCLAIKNCGPGGPYNFADAASCEAVARTTPVGVTLPATFRGSAITSPTRFQTQFLNFRVMSIAAQ